MAQKGKASWPKMHSQEAAEPGFESRKLPARVCKLNCYLRSFSMQGQCGGYK
jgi:hypothetical protein